jgi:hypothetical protein
VKLAQNRRDFTAKKCPAVVECFPKRELSQKMYDNISVKLSGKCPSYSTVKNWIARVRTGHLNTEDEECSGRPTQVTIPETSSFYWSHLCRLVPPEDRQNPVSKTLFLNKRQDDG